MEKENKIKEEKENIEQLKSVLINSSNINKDFMDHIIKSNEWIKDIKINIPVEIKSEEKMISIIFINVDEYILENFFYGKYPEYKDYKNTFILNGKKIDLKLFNSTKREIK